MSEMFQIKFDSIELVSKSLEMSDGSEVQEINFNFLVDLKVFQKLKMAVVETDVTLLRASDGAKMAYFKLLCGFEFPEFENVFKEVEENKFDIPLNVEILLKSTGLSTIRGVIYSELRGTYLQNVILPLIDVSSIAMQSREKRKNQ